MRFKKCIRCKQKRKREFFHKNLSRKDGLQAYCKQCRGNEAKRYFNKNRNKLIQKSYFYNIKLYWPDLSVEEAYMQYMFLVQMQNNKCGICKRKYTDKRLHIDHCHKTDKVRGLLCATCNRVLGMFSDTISRFKNAVYYLEN